MIEIDNEDLNIIFENLKHSVSALTGETGSGKSTAVIQEIYQSSKNSITFCVQKTKISVNYLYNYMNGILPNRALGYVNDEEYKFLNRKLKRILKTVYEYTDDKSVLNRAGSINEINEEGILIDDTQVVYVTASYIKRLFYDLITYVNICKANNLKMEPLDFCHILALDECNRGPIEYDLIMSSWLDIISKNITVPKLLLMSATFDINSTIFPKAPLHMLKDKYKKFKLDIQYHNTNYEPNSIEMLDALANKIYEKHLKNRIQYFNNEIGETYLVFVSGTKSVKYIEKKLKSDAGLRGVEIISVYGGKNFKNMTEELKIDVPDGKRRIVIATNVLETSITITNVTGIFDSMDEKINITSRNDRSELVVINISKSSAIQRAGRGGRTNDSFVYRMCTQSRFNELPESSVNEIIRIPIHRTILEIVSIRKDPLAFLDRLIKKYPILHDKIIESKKLLEKLDYIYNNEITYDATLYFKLNLSLRSCKILAKWLDLYPNLVGIGIILTSILENYNGSYFMYKNPKTTLKYNEYKDYIDNYYEQNFSRFEHRTNIGATLNMWLEFFTVNGDPLQISSENLDGFIEYSSLNYYTFTRALKDMINVGEKLSKDGLNVEFGLFTIDGVLERLIPIINKVYSDSIFIRESIKTDGEMVYRMNTGASERYYILPSEKPISKIAEYAEIIIGLCTKTIETKNGVKKNIIEVETPYVYSETNKLTLENEISSSKEQKRGLRRNIPDKKEEEKNNFDEFSTEVPSEFDEF